MKVQHQVSENLVVKGSVWVGSLRIAEQGGGGATPSFPSMAHATAICAGQRSHWEQHQADDLHAKEAYQPTISSESATACSLTSTWGAGHNCILVQHAAKKLHGHCDEPFSLRIPSAGPFRHTYPENVPKCMY